MIKRIWLHYKVCEEYRAGMWRGVSGPEKIGYIYAAAALMENPVQFREAMLAALMAWPRSCEMNLSAVTLNRLAWLGHAGCFLATQSPEETTRLGWHTLGETEQDVANRVAQAVVLIWEERYLAKTKTKR